MNGKFEKGGIPFKFENKCHEVEGFCDCVKRWWEEAHVEGYSSFVVARTLKLVKEEIKKWNKQVLGNIKIRKYNLMDSINILYVKEEPSSLCNEEMEPRQITRGELAKVILTNEISWGQKSRALWLRVRSSFFAESSTSCLP